MEKNKLKDLSINLNIETVLLQLRAESLNNSYKLNEILRLQLQIIALQKGKDINDIDADVNSKMDFLNKQFSAFLREDLKEDFDVDFDD